MKIKIIETEAVVISPPRVEHGESIPGKIEQMPTGRQWEVEIPIEPTSLKEVWQGIRGDVRELIHLAKNSLR